MSNRRVVLGGEGGSLSDRFGQINKKFRSQQKDDDRGDRRDNNVERRKRGGGQVRRGGRGDNQGKEYGLSMRPKDGGVQKRRGNITNI